MKLRTWTALARGLVLESIRRKDIWVVAILGFLIMLCAGALGFFGFEGLESFAKDLAASVVGMFSTIIAVLSASRAIPEEIRNRTLYPLLARPMTRMDLLIGKFLGTVAVTWISFLSLCFLTAISLAMFGVVFEPILLQYVFCKLLGLAVVCAVSLALSIYMTPAAAATLGCILAFGGSMMVRAMTMAYEASPSWIKPLFQFLNGVLPQYSLFDLGSRAANFGWGTVPPWVIGSLAVYAIVYSAIMLILSWAKFRNQAV